MSVKPALLALAAAVLCAGCAAAPAAQPTLPATSPALASSPAPTPQATPAQDDHDLLAFFDTPLEEVSARLNIPTVPMGCACTQAVSADRFAGVSAFEDSPAVDTLWIDGDSSYHIGLLRWGMAADDTEKALEAMGFSLKEDNNNIKSYRDAQGVTLQVHYNAEMVSALYYFR
ncbi:MAG: hypothetical protein PHD32_07580 [Eubacteriales bacterium]|nr:hypothetical protein [Eubacteriales bacterium]